MITAMISPIRLALIPPQSALVGTQEGNRQWGITPLNLKGNPRLPRQHFPISPVARALVERYPPDTLAIAARQFA
jgi:hypothetical protein